MIFDKDADRALWAMMAGCSDKRSDIAYFIKTLPKEIIMDIRRALEEKNMVSSILIIILIDILKMVYLIINIQLILLIVL